MPPLYEPAGDLSMAITGTFPCFYKRIYMYITGKRGPLGLPLKIKNVVPSGVQNRGLSDYTLHSVLYDPAIMSCDRFTGDIGY